MKRINFLDYAKALSIFFVVFVHVGFYQLNSIILFTMPLFFAVTGYSFDPYKRSFKENTTLRFRTVMLPFFGFMLLYTVIEMLRAQLFSYGSWNIALPSLANMIYGSGVIPFENNVCEYLKEIMSYKAQPETGVDVILPSNCHLWFLPAMFTGYVIFSAVAKRTINNNILKVVSVVLLLLLASVEVIFPSVWQLPFGIGRGAIGAAFMLFGFWLKNGRLLEKNSRIFHIGISAVSLIVYAISIITGSDGSAMVRSVYGPYGIWSVIMTYIGGTAGILLILELCRLIEKLPFEKIKSFLSFAGKNVIIIYSLHMAVKFLLDVIYINGLNNGNNQLMDEYKMGLIPDNSFAYMLFEAVIIITVCLLAAKMKNKKA